MPHFAIGRSSIARAEDGHHGGRFIRRPVVRDNRADPPVVFHKGSWELDGIDVLIACNLIELLADPLEQVVIGVDV
jgi:hypothetical protein